mmetsp:Transcript_2473/g.3830  ORF Transcript_2473/g.3830 Transcript_2473/m.3830 type:complete len:94 (-) Transcript_2473:2130-2411(-)
MHYIIHNVSHLLRPASEGSSARMTNDRSEESLLLWLWELSFLSLWEWLESQSAATRHWWACSKALRTLGSRKDERPMSRDGMSGFSIHSMFCL